MIKLDYSLDVCCKKCENIIKLKLKENNFKQHNEERSLGYEIEYEYLKNKKCSLCGNTIVVGIRLYEYPEDIENHKDVFGEGYFKDNLLDQLIKNK